MAINILEEKTITDITFNDGKNTGVIKLIDGNYDRIVMPHPVPKEHSKEWFAMMKEIGELILESEHRHGKKIVNIASIQEHAKAVDKAWFGDRDMEYDTKS